ncbi:MFS transporter [Citricoccus parietis]
MLYAAWRTEMGFSATVQTLVFAVYVAGLIPGLLVTGRLLSRYSARSLLLVATVVSVAGALALSVAADPGLLLAARAVQGLALGAVMSASSAALYSAVPSRPRSFTALLVTLTAIVGACLGPIGAGLLADASGGTTVPMLAAAGAVAVAAVLLLAHGRSALPALPSTVGPTPAPPVPQPAAAPQPVSEAVTAPSPAPRSHLMISLTAGTSWAMAGLYQSVGPSIIGTALGIDSLTLLGLIVATMLAVAGLVQVLSHRMPILLGRRLGLSFLMVGIGGFAAMLATGQVWLAVIAAVGAGIGHGFTYLSATQEMGELNRREPVRAAANMSRYFTVAYLCMAVFTVALGMVGDLWAMVPAAMALLGLLAAGCVAMLFSGGHPTGGPAAA